MLPLTESFLDDLPERIRRMFEGGLTLEPVQSVGWMPAIEIVEKNGALVVTAELPGLEAKDVDISVEDDVLTISGEKHEEKKEGEEGTQYYLWERRYGSFRRSFTLPSAVDAEKITANFAKGVLTITLPKSEQVKAKGRKIAIAEKK
jgi:HSP20 family protein